VSIDILITDENPISSDTNSIDMLAEEGSVDASTSGTLKYALQ